VEYDGGVDNQGTHAAKSLTHMVESITHAAEPLTHVAESLTHVTEQLFHVAKTFVLGSLIKEIALVC
jgi:hypothetical protein